MAEPEVASLEYDEDDERPLRWYVLVPFVLAIVVGFGVAVLLTVNWGVNCSKIDDGLSDVAGDSRYAGLCQSGHGVAALLIPAGWVLGLVLATFALTRWTGGWRGTVVMALVFLTPTLLPVLVAAGLERASTSCPDDKLEAYRAWANAGSKGTAPYDCRTF